MRLIAVEVPASAFPKKKHNNYSAKILGFSMSLIKRYLVFASLLKAQDLCCFFRCPQKQEVDCNQGCLENLQIACMKLRYQTFLWLSKKHKIFCSQGVLEHLTCLLI